MSFGGGGFFGTGAQQSDSTGANTINPNLGTEASQTSAPIISFQSNISTSGKNAQVVGGGSPNVTVNSSTTDFGALAAGSNIAQQGINLAGATLNLQAAQLDNIRDISANTNATIAGIAKTGLDNAVLTQQNAYQFSGNSLNSILDVFKSSLAGIEDYTQNLVGDVIGANKAATAQTITGLTDLSARTTTSSDQRIADTAKYAIYGAAAIGIAIALSFMSRK
jgi:hypothetical protein